MTSGMPHATTHTERVAYIEEALEDDDNTTVPGSRRSANVAAKRSKPVHDSANSESGKAVVKHSTRNRSNEVDPVDLVHPHGTEYASKSSRMKSSEAARPSSSKGKEPAEKGRGLIGKLMTKSKKSDKAPSGVEGRKEAARMHPSGNPVGPPPVLVQSSQPPAHGATMMPPSLQIPPPHYSVMVQPAGPNFHPLIPMGPPIQHRPNSYHAGMGQPMMINDPAPYQQGGPIPPQQQILPPNLMHPQFMPGPSPTSPRRAPEYHFPPSIPYHPPYTDQELQRTRSHNRRSVAFVDSPSSNQQTSWGSLPDGNMFGISRQPSLHRREVVPGHMPGSWDYYDEERDFLEQERMERARMMRRVRLEQELLEREAIERKVIERERRERELTERAHMEREFMERERMERERMERERMERERIERERIDRERMERELVERIRTAQARLDRERMPPPPRLSQPQIHQAERPPMRRPVTTGTVHTSHRHSFVGPGPSIPEPNRERHSSHYRNHDTVVVDEDALPPRRHRDSNSSHKSFNRRSLTKHDLPKNDEAEAIDYQEKTEKTSRTKLSSPTVDDIKRTLQRRTKTQASETGSRTSKASKASRKSGSSEGKKKREDNEERMILSMDANKNIKVDISGDPSKDRTIEFRQNKDQDGGVAVSIGGKGQRKGPEYHTSVSSARSGRSHRDTIYENEPSGSRPPSSVRETEYVRTNSSMRDNPSTRDAGSTRATAGSRRASVSRGPEYVRRTVTSTRRTGSSRDTEYQEGARPESRMGRAATTVDEPPRRSREDDSHRNQGPSHSRPPVSGRWDHATEDRPRGSSRARAPSQSSTDGHFRSSSRGTRAERHEHRRESRVYRDPSTDSRADRNPSPRRRDSVQLSKVTSITKSTSRGSVPEKSPSGSPQEEDFVLASKTSTIHISSDKDVKSRRSPSPPKRASPPTPKASPSEMVSTPSPVPKERENASRAQSRVSDLERHGFTTERRSHRRASSVMAGMRYVMGDKRARGGG